MKKTLKITGYSLLVVLVLITLLLVYVKNALPSVPVENVRIELTAKRIAKGEYLFHHVADCYSCHSERQTDTYPQTIISGTEGAGGMKWDQTTGLPGSYIAPNITPYHLGSWTDGELLRAITTGVSKNGKALFPLMPYLNYGQLDKEDIYSIIAYLRTLKPIEKEWPASSSDFPVNFIINTIPKKADFHPIPERSDSINYGKYLVTMADCAVCHSQFEKLKTKEGTEFGGGLPFKLETGDTIFSANITPDRETGIGAWTREMFIQRFRMYADSSFHPASAPKGKFNSVMPWDSYGKMSPEDLGAIYTYLRTVKPIKQPVTKFHPAQ